MDLRLLLKTMGHASITVTAHVYADLYDDELDVASALDALDDRPSATVFVPGVTETVLVFPEVASRCPRNAGFALVERIESRSPGGDSQ